MYKNLEMYVKVYREHVDPAFCRQIVEELKDAQFQTHTFYDVVKNTSHSYEKELDISYHPISGEAELHQLTWNGIKQYIDELQFDWFGAWSGHTKIRFNQYRAGTQMKEHCDHIHSMFDGERKGIPTLSIVGVLNDDYEGGEFVMWQDRNIKLKTGDLLIFPSNFLYPHRVNEVTSGTRNTFVSWTW
jgi:hypothetical protein